MSLDTLHIKNVGIIEQLEINFKDKLNVLTGETGSGKSLIINSINLVCGGRFSKELIRTGQDFLQIEALFTTKDNKQVSLFRKTDKFGKNICKINGTLVTVNELANCSKELIEIHGQLDNAKVLDVSSHISYLDMYAHDKIDKLKKEYAIEFEKYNQIQKKLKENFGDDAQKMRELEFLNYQIKEIENINPKIGEDEENEKIRQKMINQELIAKNLKQSLDCVNEVLTLLNTSKNSMAKIENLDVNYSKILDNIQNNIYDIEEISYDLRDNVSNTEYWDNARDEIENRIEQINMLKRKYGKTITDILEFKEKANKRIDKIQNLEQYISSLKKQKEQIENSLQNIAIKLSNQRKETATKFEDAINEVLKKLEMKNAHFHVKISNTEFNLNGIDDVCFMIRTNKGEKEKQLVKIASGGEMSRIMLAIKSQIAKKDNLSTIIFDEVDTGISGDAANAVADLMTSIASSIQVICISHLPNIAAVANTNYYISKYEKDGRTFSKVDVLNEMQVLDEIARISSGKITKASLGYAKELRDNKVEINK